MKPASKLLSAASAAAISVGLAGAVGTTVDVTYFSVAEAAVVNTIQVSGNRRVDDETIRNYVGIKPGRNFSNADIDEGVKRLFATGLFADVSITQSGRTLVITVDEYAVVNQVLFQGNKKVKDADLARATQLSPRGTFTNEVLEADVQAVKDAYAAVGRSDAVVTTDVIDLGEGRVNVVFNINEGGRTKIATIAFVGNNAFSDRRLREVIDTKQSNFLSFLFRDDVYDEQKLRADEEALRRFYYNRGYADFQVISSSAELDDVNNQYQISFTIEEGERYTFGDVAIESTVDGIDGDSLRPLLDTRSGAVYSAKDVEDTIIAITERVAEEGFAFAQVTPRGDRDFANRTISVVYTIDQGPRTYIDRIVIRGNTRTRDYVIRREFDVTEGDAFNPVLIQRAKRRLEDLDYFTSVNISTAPGSQPDQVVVVVDVLEKSTGEFSVGAGYSTGGSNEGVSVELSVTERNFLGRGQFIRVSAGGGSDTRNFGFSFTEPYFLGRRISAGFDLYRQTREYTYYETEVTGGSIRFGLPITEALSFRTAYNYSEEEYLYTTRCDDNGDLTLGDCTALSPVIHADIARSPWKKSSVSGTLTFNTIDDEKNPREGIFATASLEYAGVGGDANYLAATARGSYYHLLSDELDVVGVLSGGAGHIEPVGGTGLRSFDLFRSNERMIRGFENGGIGPVDVGVPGTPRDDHLGGTTYFHASAEAIFPMPAVPESLGIKAAVFADAATLFGNDIVVPGATIVGTSMEWRASVGAGIVWNSPFGPLRVNYAVPVLKETTDKVEEFSFGVSSRF